MVLYGCPGSAKKLCFRWNLIFRSFRRGALSVKNSAGFCQFLGEFSLPNLRYIFDYQLDRRAFRCINWPVPAIFVVYCVFLINNRTFI